MWHVDEGTLHAFLDERERPGSALDAEGCARVAQHVLECTACAAALEREAHVRGLAAGVLADAAPAGLELPRFDEIGAPARVPRRRRSWTRYAWAASLVAAVGAGWMGSELWRSGVATPAGMARERAADAVAPQPAPSAAVANRAETDPSPAATGRSEPRGDGSAGGAAVPGGVAARRAQPEAAEEAEAVAVTPTAAPAGPPAVGAVQADASLLRRGEGVAQKAAEPVAREERAAVPQRQLLLQESFAVAPAVGVAQWPGDEDVAWRPVTREAAERQLGAGLRLVPEVAADSLAASEGGRIRAWQRLPEGTVEIIQWAGAAAAGDLAAGVAPAFRTGTARDSAEFAWTAVDGVEIAVKAPRGTRAAPLLLRVLGGPRR